MNKNIKKNIDSKLAHINACLNSEVEYKKSAGFNELEFENQAVLDISFNEIDVSLNFLNKKIFAPVMIAPMTGGIKKGAMLNRVFARAAEKWNIPYGIGSQRLALEKSERVKLFKIRKYAPNAIVFANIGAAQLCNNFNIIKALNMIEMVRADAIFIHLNAMQEISQSLTVNFNGLVNEIGKLCQKLKIYDVPVFAREVCFGISKSAAKILIDAGVSGIDCAGAGGTSWSKVESICANNMQQKKIGKVFGEWGIPTVESIKNVRSVSSSIPLIACGGLKNGIDLAKSLALGADIGAFARRMLLSAMKSEECLNLFIKTVILELKISMFGVGVKNLSELKNVNLLKLCNFYVK